MPGEFLPPTIASLQADIADFETGMAEAEGTLDNLQARIDALHGKDIPIEADILQAMGSIAEVEDAIKAIPDEKIIKIRADADEALAGAGTGRGDGGGGLLGLLGGALTGGGGRLGGRRFGIGYPIAQASLLGMAGLGPLALTGAGIGVGVSGAGAALGGGLLGLGQAGVTGVGMGSDMAVMRDMTKEAKVLSGSLGQLTQAQQQFGAGSKQAAQAQQALNEQMKLLSAQIGPQAAAAIMGVAQHVNNLKNLWDTQTAAAKIGAAQLAQSFLSLGDTYIPLIGAAAARNFGIINANIRPLIDYLRGPATAVFGHLEDIFAAHLPLAIHAGTQGLELLIRTIDLAASHLTGGLTRSIDSFLTRMNGADWSKWSGAVEHLIGLFHTWVNLGSAVAHVIYDIFHADAQTGTAIIQTLTGMLDRLHAYLSTAQGHDALHSVFEAHKEAILALLNALEPLAVVMGRLELATVPALAEALATLLQVITPLLNLVAGNPFTGFILGATILAAKMGILMPIIRGVQSALGAGGTNALAASQDRLAASANAAAASMERLAAATETVAGPEAAAAGEANALAAANARVAETGVASEAGMVGMGGAARTAEGDAAGLAGRLGSTASFLTGPWGIAIGAAGLGLGLLGKHLADMAGEAQHTADNMGHVTTSAEEAAHQGFDPFSVQVLQSNTNLKDLASQLGTSSDKLFFLANAVGMTSADLSQAQGPTTLLNHIRDLASGSEAATPQVRGLAQNIMRDWNTAAADIPPKIKAIGDAITGLNTSAFNMQPAIQQSHSGIEAIKAQFGLLPGQLGTALAPVPGAISTPIAQGGAQAKTSASQTAQAVPSLFGAAAGPSGVAGQNTGNAFTGGITAGGAGARGAGASVGNAGVGGLGSMARDANAAGSNLGGSFADGLAAQASRARAAGQTVASNATSGLMEHQRSPDTEGIRAGMNLGLGYAIGLESMAGRISTAAQAMVAGAYGAVAPTAPGAFGNASGQAVVINQENHFHGVSDKDRAVIQSGMASANADVVRQIRALTGRP